MSTSEIGMFEAGGVCGRMNRSVKAPLTALSDIRHSAGEIEQAWGDTHA